MNEQRSDILGDISEGMGEGMGEGTNSSKRATECTEQRSATTRRRGIGGYVDQAAAGLPPVMFVVLLLTFASFFFDLVAIILFLKTSGIVGSWWIELNRYLMAMFYIFSLIARLQLFRSPYLHQRDPKSCRWCAHTLVEADNTQKTICSECGRDQTVSPAVPIAYAAQFVIAEFLMLHAVLNIMMEAHWD
ncbi:MAG: hypothetical protein DWI12_12875 [Planctomycetota bacterium]|nr:MAG: hypothetical protein DWI12_12875 [Planctomycetota bacterium]